MSQNDLSIANQGFASFRSDLNSALQALGSTNSGTSAPSTTYANQLFYDTTNNILKIRNEDNDAFISLFTLDQANDNIESLTINGAFACEGFTSNGIDDNADATAITIDSSENVGLGTVSPSTKFHVKVGTNQNFNVFAPGVGSTGVTLGATTDGFGAFAEMEQRATQFVFHNGTTERMRIDSSGSLRIANTSGTLYNSSSATGTVAGTSLQVSTDGATVGFFNRLSSIGQILGFYNDGVQVGQINVGTLSSAGRILIGNSNCNLLFNDAIPEIVPASSNGVKRDGSIDFGNATGRFQDIRATNGTIQTSDKNEKNTIVDSDLGIDFINRLSPKSYKFNNKTRTHYGLIAQDVETVLGSIKKDASQFAGFCKDDISEKQDGSEYRYGLRYHEFISPMIQAIKDLKAEVDTLKAKVATLESK